MSPRGPLLLLAAWIASVALAWSGPARCHESRWTESTRLVVGVETRLRLLSDVPSRAQRAARPHLVAIVWRYGEDGGERLLPSTVESLRILHAETLLHEGIERAGIGVLVAVMTGGLQHEWLYYAADPRELASAFNRIAADSPDWPVRLLTEFDPEWDAYLALRRREFALR
jgi:hypothetical protein